MKLGVIAVQTVLLFSVSGFADETEFYKYFPEAIDKVICEVAGAGTVLSEKVDSNTTAATVLADIYKSGYRDTATFLLPDGSTFDLKLSNITCTIDACWAKIMAIGSSKVGSADSSFQSNILVLSRDRHDKKASSVEKKMSANGFAISVNCQEI